VPHSQQTCDMCDTGVVGTSTMLCLSARPLLRLGPTMHPCLRPSPGLRALAWQPNLQMIARYVYDCFQGRARVWTASVIVQLNQPHQAALMHWLHLSNMPQQQPWSDNIALKKKTDTAPILQNGLWLASSETSQGTTYKQTWAGRGARTLPKASQGGSREPDVTT
jgi:hypothetical protein